MVGKGEQCTMLALWSVMSSRSQVIENWFPCYATVPMHNLVVKSNSAIAVVDDEERVAFTKSDGVGGD